MASHSFLIRGTALALFVVATTVVPAIAQEGKTIFGANQAETLKSMKSLAQSLGVKCQDCHLKAGGKLNYKADTERKKVVRQMKHMLVDSLAQKGSGEISIPAGSHKTTITALYQTQGDAPGIQLTLAKFDKTYSKTIALPAAGHPLTCMTCHNGQLNFLTPEAGHDQAH